MARRESQAGFTLIEVLIGAAIMVAVVAACLGTQLSSTNLMGEAVKRAQLEEAAIFAVKEVAFDVRWAEGAALVLSTESGCARLDLHTATAYAAGHPVWSSTITYHVVASPNDANGNGIADDHKLVRVQGGKTHVICDGVMAGGFTATRTGESLALQVRLNNRHRGRLIVVTGATSATIRN